MSNQSNSDSDSSSSRRTLLKAVGSGGIASIFAGCAGGGQETPTTTTSMETTTAEATPTETTTETTESTDQQKFPVTITQGQMPTTLDPHDNRSIPTDIVMMQAYESLLRRDRKGNIQPSLATRWERKEPGRVRFFIREGPTFHKTGNPLTPEDVAYSINRIVDPDVGFKSPQASQLAGVTGAEVVDGKRAVDIISDGLNPLIFAQLPNNGQVMEKQWVKNHKKSYIAKNINGTGPFELSE
ncbi:MAG: ABC transporter substrate-binding protein, partial [Halobacteriaceae archaeon]